MATGSAPPQSSVTIEEVSPGFAPLASCSGTINSTYPNECTYTLPNGAAQGTQIGTESFVVPGGTDGQSVTQQALFCPVSGSCGVTSVAVSGPGKVIASSGPPPDRPVALQPFEINAVEGAQFDGTVGILTDLDPNGSPTEYSAAVNWGDGTPTAPATFNGWTITGAHTYSEEGTFTLTVQVTDRDNQFNRTSGARTATVADAPLTSYGTDRISMSHFSDLVASFKDDDQFGTPSDYTASIDWGDGTSNSGTIQANYPYFGVVGSHDYAVLGAYTVSVHICDVGGSCTDASESVLTYGVSAGGNFVIGDGNAAINSSVTFWGAQWTSQNSLSGGDAPSAFKGFADNPSTTPRCLLNWSTSPGNSSSPPDEVPTYMAVTVASSINKDGPRIRGNSAEVVIVRTDPSYGPDPATAGTGTVVAVLCP